MNQSELEANACGPSKCGKTRASKSRLVLVLLLIGRGSGARFFNEFTKRSNALNQIKVITELLSTLN